MKSSGEKFTITEEILVRATDDWISTAEVMDVAKLSGLHQPDDLRDFSIGLIVRLMMDGLLIAGDCDESGHTPWASSTAESIVRIIREWTAKDDVIIMPGEIVWFDLSARGEQLALDILKRNSA